MITKPKDAARAAAVPSPNGRENDGNEYYQSLVSRLQSAANGDPAPKVVGVTSCTRGEGVSTVAERLAAHAAGSLALPILLIDVTNSLASTGRTSGRNAALGLSDLLAGEADPPDCIQQSSIDHLFILGGGKNGISAGANFAPARVAELLESLREEFEFIVLDLPTISDVSICLSLASALDGVLLVVEAERVRSPIVERCKRQLDEASACLLGVVLNKCRDRTPR